MQLAPNVAKVQTVCLLILTGVAVGFALSWLSTVLIPFVIAVLLYVCLGPVMRWQRRLRVPQPLAVAGGLLVVLLAVAALGAVATAAAAELRANIATYQQQFRELVGRVEQWPIFDQWTSETAAGEAKQIDLQKVLDPGTAGQFLLGLMNAVTGLLSQAVIVLLFLLFLLLGQRGPPPAESGLWFEVKQRLRTYLLLKTLISVVTGVLVGTALAWLGVDLALVFGLFAFLLNFVPNVGSIIATLLPLPVVLMSQEISTTTAVLAIAIPGAIQFVVGSVLDPMIMGDSLDLHPVTVLLALIFWGMLWGVIGVLLAVPLTAALRILLERLDTTAPVARAMAGRFSS
jgi:AI-2 transport protein TqsA